MASMKFVVKYFPEIVIKSKPVRRRFVGQLVENLRAVLRDIDSDVMVKRSWDKLQIESQRDDAAIHARLVDAMRHAPGITYILEVSEYPLPALENMIDKVLPVYGE